MRNVLQVMKQEYDKLNPLKNIKYNNLQHFD